MNAHTLPHLTVELHHAAHGRTGDKGNTSNISLIAWHPALWPYIVEQITAEAVQRQFAYRQPSRVTRYLLPKLHAMNFVLEDALDGGVNSALNLDSHGKTLSYHLLALPLCIPIPLKDHLVGQAWLPSS